jgi:hypothetical protein
MGPKSVKVNAMPDMRKEVDDGEMTYIAQIVPGVTTGGSPFDGVNMSLVRYRMDPTTPGHTIESHFWD